MSIVNGYRLPKLTFEQLEDSQQLLWNSILSSPRGKSAVDHQGHLAGPFDLFLRSPKTGVVVTAVGEQLRYGTKLSQRVLELAIVIVAAHWNASFEWAWHAPLALKAGVDPNVLQSLKLRARPHFGSDKIDETVFEVVTEILQTGSCDDETYKRAEKLLGVQALVDLIAVAGYYTLLAFALGVFRVQATHKGEDGELMRLDPPTASQRHKRTSS
jgi:4-carboxymuconolactone decarboxylase